MIADPQQLAFEELDALGLEELEKVKELIAKNPETGKQDYIGLLARLIAAVGSVAGVYLWRVIYLTGRSSKLEGGWFYKSREEMREETGQGHREQEKARKILTGQKEYAGRTIRVLQERRPSRRRPAHYRADVLAVAELLGVDVSAIVAESPRGATQEADEAPDGPESPRGATEPPREAAESHVSWGDFKETAGEDPAEIPLAGGAPQRAAPQATGEGEARKALDLLREKLPARTGNLIKARDWGELSRTLDGYGYGRFPEPVIAFAARARAPELAGMAS